MNPEQQSSSPQDNNQPQQAMQQPTMDQQPLPQQMPQQTFGSPQQTLPQAGVPKKNKKLLVIVVVIIAVMLIAGVAFMTLKKSDEKQEPNTAPATTEKDDSISAKSANGSDNTSTGTGQDEAIVRANDIQHRSNIFAIHGKLEEFYNNYNYYPAQFTASTLSGIDERSLIDENGATISIVKPVSNKDAVKAVPNPTNTGPVMQYIPYLCSSNECQGYVLRAYIAKPSGTATNTLIKESLN